MSGGEVLIHGLKRMTRIAVKSVLVERGIQVEESSDVPDWLENVEGIPVLIIDAEGDMEAATDFRTVRPDLLVIAFVSQSTLDGFLSALRNGAVAAFSADDEPVFVADCVIAALEGHSLLPTPIAFAIASTNPIHPEELQLTDQEIDWLRLLAGGSTVERLAQEVGYSRRQFSRILKALYGRLGVTTKIEAVAKAAQFGLTTTSSPPEVLSEDVKGL